MTARAIGELVSGKHVKPVGTRRTFQPVRRGSRNRGEREEKIWRPLGSSNREARRFIAATLQAADFYDIRNKQPGRWNGPLGAIGREVLRALFQFADWKTGRLEPAIATICQRIGRSRAAVCRALARLKAHGFLDWLRRSEPTENVGAGPQVRQITNAYGFDIQTLPKAARAFVKKALNWGAPVPDDELARQDQDRADVDAMLDTLSNEEVARNVGPVDNPELEELLVGLGRALDKSASSPKGLNPGDGE